MKQYNFYNLEASFISFLNSGNRDLSKVTIKNYISAVNIVLKVIKIQINSFTVL